MPNRSNNSKKLALQFSHGDPEIIEKLYQQHKPAILRHISLLASDPVDIEAILQETYLRIWHSAHRYDAEKGSLYNWILTLTDNTARDYMNSQSAID